MRRLASTLAGRRPFPVEAATANDRAREPEPWPRSKPKSPSLLDRSTHELRLAWRQLHRAEPPHGLSRDLLIRALAHQLQEQSYGGTGRALRRRLQTLTGEREKRGASFDPAIVLKTGTTLVRQWRGHTHAVLVRDDGFEYEGERYRSLSVIAKRITGAHWSGPRFFGLTKPAGASAAAEADR